MSTATTYFGLTKPGVNDPIDANQWGTQLNANLDAVDTLHNRWRTTDIGSSRPADAQAGTMWIDNSATPWIMYVYDGTQDVAIGEVDTVDGQFLPSNSGSSTLLLLSAPVTFAFGDTNIAVPDLTFTIKAGQKYLLTISGQVRPDTNWGPGAAAKTIEWKVVSGLSFTVIGGSFVNVNVVTASSTSNTTVFYNTAQPFRICGGSVTGSDDTRFNVFGHIYIQGGGSDETFSTVLNWIITSGTSSNTGSLIYAYMTYEEVN